MEQRIRKENHVSFGQGLIMVKINEISCRKEGYEYFYIYMFKLKPHLFESFGLNIDIHNLQMV